MVETVNQKKPFGFLDFKILSRCLPVAPFLLYAALLDSERMAPKTEKPFLKNEKCFISLVLQNLDVRG